MHYKIRPVNSTIASSTTTTSLQKSFQTLSVPTTVVDLGKQLLVHARDGNVAAVKSLILSEAPFAGDWLGMTALHFAAMNNHYEICEILLKNGINKDSRAKTDRTALHLACHNGSERIVRLLLSKNCEINPCDVLQMTPLHLAIEKRHKSIARLLLSHNANVTVLSKFNRTPISLAVLTGQTDLVKELQVARRKQIEQIINAPIETEIFTAVNSIIEHDQAEEDMDLSENSTNSTVNFLQKHGISLQKHKENESKDLLNTVLKNGRQFILSEGGKMLLSEASNKKSPIKSPSNSILLTATSPPTSTVNLPRNITLNTLNKNAKITLPNLQILPPAMKLYVNPNSNRLNTSSLAGNKQVRTLETIKLTPNTKSENDRNIEVTSLDLKPVSSKKSHIQVQQEHKSVEADETLKGESDELEILTPKETESNPPEAICIKSTGCTSINTTISSSSDSSSSCSSTPTVRRSVIPLFTINKQTCADNYTIELRRQNNELKRKLELSQREKEDMRLRLERLENHILQKTKTNSTTNDDDYIISS